MSLGWSRSRDAAVERRGWSALGRGQATLDRIVTTGYDGRGKRVVRKAAGRTKTEAKTKLRDLLHDRDEGLSESSCTVGQAVEDWLSYGLGSRGRARFRSTEICGRRTLIRSSGSGSCGT